MKCIPKHRFKKNLAGYEQLLIVTEIRLFPVFWGWFDGEKLGNTLSNVAQGLVMTGRLMLLLFQPGNIFRSLKRKPSL